MYNMACWVVIDAYPNCYHLRKIMVEFILLCLILCLYTVWTLRLRTNSSLNLAPLHSGVLPIVGHTHIILGSTTYLWRIIKDASRECTQKGGVIRVFIGPQLHYLITDPDDTYTAANACLQKHNVYNFLKAWFGDGLITASGPIWKHHRKLLNPAFNLQVLNGFLETFNSQARKLVHEVSPNTDNGPFDVSTYLRNNTLETTCLTVFGVNTEGNKNFNKMYMEALDKIFVIVTQRFQKIWLHSNFIYKLFGWKNREAELIEILNDMSNNIIQKKKAAIKEKSEQFEDTPKTTGSRFKPFLDLLLELSDGDMLTDKEIREEVDTVIAAGFETSSWVLMYTLIFLGSYPETQDRVIDELQEVFGNSDRDVTKEDLAKLVYTEAVLKESMRLYPIVPVILRYIDKDVKLKNYTMQAGTNCIFLTYGLHRHPVWGPDAEEFKPERWLDSKTLPSSNAYGAFSLGQRSCIGKTYALMSSKTVLVHLLREYRIEADITKLVCKVDIVLKPVYGEKISFKKRGTTITPIKSKYERQYI